MTTRSTPSLSTATMLADAVALASEGGTAPEWIKLFPDGPTLAGCDGRSWRMDDPAAVIAATRLPVALDYDHAMDVNAPSKPASGWVEELKLRGAAIWGRVNWTPRAAQALAAREWRFFSPAFDHAPDGAVARLVGGALVNRPAFRQLPALAAAQPAHEDLSMLKSICVALGLSEAATEAEAVVTIAALRENHRVALAAAQTPPLDKFAPRAELDAALARATAAETQIATQAKTAHETRVTAAVDGAIKAGKVAPVSRDYYLSSCASAEGLAQFEKFVATMPSVFGRSDLDKRDPDAPGLTRALTADQKAVAANMGIPEADFAKHLAAGAA